MNIKTTTTLVLGASGATGNLLVRKLLGQNQNVKAVVRSKEKLMQKGFDDDSKQLSIIEGTVLDMSDEELKRAISGCDAVVSCLGHNLTMKGVYGKPRRLVKDSITRVCDTIEQLTYSQKTKFILMGSDGVANPDGSDSKRSCVDRTIISLLRLLLPPHVDNEKAAAYLHSNVKKETSKVEWVIVRPSDLIDADESEYEVVPNPTGSLFGDTETSRANVAAFMSELILREDLWKKWLFQCPVILNTETEQAP